MPRVSAIAASGARLESASVVVPSARKWRRCAECGEVLMAGIGQVSGWWDNRCRLLRGGRLGLVQWSGIWNPGWDCLSSRCVCSISKAFRALRVLLSCVAKKVSKEGHPAGPPSALCAAGSQSGGAFPEGTSMCRPETSRVVRAALRVFASPACRASTGLGAISRACVRRAYECVDSGEPESGSASGRVQPVRECCRTACRGRGGPYNPSMKTFTSGG